MKLVQTDFYTRLSLATLQVARSSVCLMLIQAVLACMWRPALLWLCMHASPDGVGLRQRLSLHLQLYIVSNEGRRPPFSSLQ